MTLEVTPDDEAVWEIPDSLRLELLARLSAAPTRRRFITFEEFLEWADEDTLAEWVDGEVEMASPASGVHQDLGGFLYGTIEIYARVHELGVVRMAPFLMKLPRSAREPDVLFVATQHLARLTPTYLNGPADMAIEILSPESERRDRADKFYEYRDGGVPEYWMLDPERKRAELYRLDQQGAYVPLVPDDTGAYHSEALPGFWFRTEWLWRTRLPEALAAMFTIDPEGARAYLKRNERGIE
jgi:Uma2 family endonuclease